MVIVSLVPPQLVPGLEGPLREGFLIGVGNPVSEQRRQIIVARPHTIQVRAHSLQQLLGLRAVGHPLLVGLGVEGAVGVRCCGRRRRVRALKRIIILTHLASELILAPVGCAVDFWEGKGGGVRMRWENYGAALAMNSLKAILKISLCWWKNNLHCPL